MAFLENPYNKEEVNHIDGNKFNNNINNLEWCTPLENQRHKIETLKKDNKGKNNPMFGRIGKFSPKFKDFILQIKDGVVINKFESTLEAARFLNNGVNTNGSSKISICLSKKKYNGRRLLTYKGFKWIFENEWIQNLANSGKPLTIKDEGNPDPSLI